MAEYLMFSVNFPHRFIDHFLYVVRKILLAIAIDNLDAIQSDVDILQLQLLVRRGSPGEVKDVRRLGAAEGNRAGRKRFLKHIVILGHL